MRSRSQLQVHAARTLDALRVTPGRQLVEAPPLAAGTSLLWAKITTISTNTVMAKFADAVGNVQAAEFRVYVYATNVTGVTWTPTLTDASPNLVVGQYIQVVQMLACGAERPAGWYMIGPPLSLTCAPSGA
jgi:hypothetical protein